MVPGQHLAAFVETDACAVQMHRTIVATAHVVLAAPQCTYRHVQAGGAGGLSNLAGLDHEIAAAGKAPAETAACHLHMHLHLLRLDAQNACDCGAVQAGALRAGPYFCTNTGERDGTVERLHGGMGQVGKYVLDFQLTGSCRQRRHVCVELARPRLSGKGAVLGQLLFAVHFLDGGGIPLQLQRVAPLFGRPVAIGDHGYAFGATIQRHTQHCLDAFHGTCRAIIHRRQAGAEHRRARHHSRQLTRQVDVNSELLSTAALGARVQTCGGTTDDAEIFGIFQCDFLGHGKGHRGFRQFTVTQLSPSSSQYRTSFRAQGSYVDIPARRGGAHQHGPGTRAELAILREAVLDRIGTTGEVNAEKWINVGRVV